MYTLPAIHTLTLANHFTSPLTIVAAGVEFTVADSSPIPPPVSHYIPVDLWECNIGTNDGLHETLDRLDDFYSTHDHSEHVYVVADVNIYWQYHRVCRTSALEVIRKCLLI